MIYSWKGHRLHSLLTHLMLRWSVWKPHKSQMRLRLSWKSSIFARTNQNLHEEKGPFSSGKVCQWKKKYPPCQMGCAYDTVNIWVVCESIFCTLKRMKSVLTPLWNKCFKWQQWNTSLISVVIMLMCGIYNKFGWAKVCVWRGNGMVFICMMWLCSKNKKCGSWTLTGWSPLLLAIRCTYCMNTTWPNCLKKFK